MLKIYSDVEEDQGGKRSGSLVAVVESVILGDVEQVGCGHLRQPGVKVLAA